MKQTMEPQRSKEKKIEPTSNSYLYAVIRIHGMVEVKQGVSDSLDRLRLRRKYACVLLDAHDKNMAGMLKKVHYFVAYGPIDRAMLVKLIKERGKSAEGNSRKITVDADEVADGILSGKKLSDFGLKPFFRLHPPRGGINSKQAHPNGVLGNHKEKINKLLERMM